MGDYIEIDEVDIPMDLQNDSYDVQQRVTPQKVVKTTDAKPKKRVTWGTNKVRVIKTPTEKGVTRKRRRKKTKRRKSRRRRKKKKRRTERS